MLRNRLRKMAELVGVTAGNLGVDGLFVLVGGVVRMVGRVERPGRVYGRHGGAKGTVVHQERTQSAG